MLHMLQVEGLHIAVVRKQVRGLRLSVRRADGRLRVSAPWHTPEATIRELVAQNCPGFRSTKRLSWRRRRFLRCSMWQAKCITTKALPTPLR